MAKQALPGKRGNYINVPARDLEVIRYKSHILYDPRIEEPLDQGFLANIDSEGVRVPVLVAKLTIDDTQRNIVIDGKRRLMAVEKANERRARSGEPLLTVPAIAVKGNDLALFALMVLANECRSDDGPLAKASKVARFVALYAEAKGGGTGSVEAEEQAATIFGTSTKTIKARLKLLQTAPGVQKAVEQGSIGWWAASEFAGTPIENQEKAVTELIATGGTRGGKPQVEDAKRKVGKGNADHRAKLAEALQALKEAAEEYGSAEADGENVRDLIESLKNAAGHYYKVSSAPKK